MNHKPTIKTIAIIAFGIDILFMAIAILRAIILQRSPMRYFGDQGFISWLSIIQLIVIAVLCWKISNCRQQPSKSSRFPLKRNPVVFWRITALGMFFFSLDEIFQIHENLDKELHKIFQVQETSLTGMLDDFIILFYAVSGLLLIFLYRREFKNFVAAFSWFAWGLLFSFMTIILDMGTHNRANFAPFADSLEQLNRIHHWTTTVEEIPKILAEAAFIVTFYKCLQIAKTIRAKSNLSKSETEVSLF